MLKDVNIVKADSYRRDINHNQTVLIKKGKVMNNMTDTYCY